MNARGTALDPAPGKLSSRPHSDVLWQPREASVGESVAQYSRFVGRMKIVLPAVAGIVLLLVMLLPQFRGESDRFRVGVKTLSDITSDTLSMVNARFVGADDQGRPYLITAASARERSTEDKTIDLVKPRAELTMSDGAWLKISATTGAYDRNLQVVELGGQVDVFQEQGYEMHSSAARISMKEKIASGNAPVSGKGSFGTIEAAGFSITDNGRIVNFTGPVTLVLESKSNDGETEASGEARDPETKP